ncbi:rod shape-determining protein [Zongyangia hominis]|nr:rod shape-determining protein [Zongyangia hominis]
MDIGIDLGTTTVIIYCKDEGAVLSEPSVVAVKRKTEEVVAVGEEAYKMLGKAPDRLEVIKPMSDGVISDYSATEVMIKFFLQKVFGGSILKPRVCLCVPSQITGVESRAVVDSAVSAGARKVYLIEEPVAAALGAGLDITHPNGTMIVDVGGGTTDIAVLSLNGIVTKHSIKVAGNKLDDMIIKHMKDFHSLLIGEQTARQIKTEVGCAYPREDDKEVLVRGRNLLTGLPQQITVGWKEIYGAIKDPIDEIVHAAQQVIERTPPELVGDVFENGMVLTGGGSLLHGLDTLLTEKTRIQARIADDPIHCVARGTSMAFDYLDKLYDGFVDTGIKMK